MSRKTPHTSCIPGSRVYVETRDGERFVDKFREKKGNYRLFDNHKIHKGNIAVFFIVKGNSGHYPEAQSRGS